VKTIVLTGVSRGLGRAMAEHFIAAGHTVLGCARSDQKIEKLRRAFGPPHDFQTVDVGVVAEVEQWARRLLKSHGPPDLLINNAALINRNAPLWRVSPAEFSSVIDVNIKGIFNTIHSYVPAMLKARLGVIVNFSSGWGRSVEAEVAPYCATKFAVEGLTRALALELPAGLAAIPLNPGIIDTPMLRSCFGGSSASYEAPDKWAARAVPFILSLGPKQNGQSLTVPD
jgi:NAD(P)-dependent dehydrogenase (short-subunit alcohol dehydrogenase family)